VNYVSGTGTNTLTFDYTVAGGDTSSDLDYVSTSSLTLNGGTIKSVSTTNASLTLPTVGGASSLAGNEAIIVDTTNPQVSSVTSSTVNGDYNAPDVISVQVVFSEIVNVTGTPQLTLETGATDAVVNYTSGSGTNTLTFNYTVASGDTSSDLDYVSTGSLALNGGTILDAANNVASLTLATPGAAGSLGANKAIIVDTVLPTITSVTSPDADTTYGAGQTVSVQVVFSEIVNVTGTPQLTLETGSTDAVVNYTSGTGTDTLTFDYTIPVGAYTADLDYKNTASLALNGGTIADGALNNATITLANPGAAGSLGANKAIIIDAIFPEVIDITSTTSNGYYNVPDVIVIKIQFNKIVNVTGTPQLTLETGATDAVVNYTTGTGTDTLTFNYTVASGDTSSDLDYVSTTSLALNGGTILDVPLNVADITLPAPGTSGSLGNNKTIIIDTDIPTVLSDGDLATASDSGLSTTDNITGDTTPTLTGSGAEANTTVKIYDGVALVCTTTSDGSGNWSCTTSAL
jgi:Bacterial Ig-like domain